MFSSRKKKTNEVITSSCLKEFSKMLSINEFEQKDIDDFKELIESDTKTANELAKKVWKLKKSDPIKAAELETKVIQLNDEIRIARHCHRVLIEKLEQKPHSK